MYYEIGTPLPNPYYGITGVMLCVCLLFSTKKKRPLFHIYSLMRKDFFLRINEHSLHILQLQYYRWTDGGWLSATMRANLDERCSAAFYWFDAESALIKMSTSRTDHFSK